MLFYRNCIEARARTSKGKEGAPPRVAAAHEGRGRKVDLDLDLDSTYTRRRHFILARWFGAFFLFASELKASPRCRARRGAQ